MHVAPHSWRRSAEVLAPVCKVFGASLLKPFRPAPPYALRGRFAERVCRVSADLRQGGRRHRDGGQLSQPSAGPAADDAAKEFARLFKDLASTRLSPSRLPGRKFPGTGVSSPPQTPERSTSRRLWCGARVSVREGSGRPLQRSMASTGPCSPSSSGSTSAATGSSPRLKTAR